MSKKDFELGDEIWFMDSIGKPKTGIVVSLNKGISIDNKDIIFDIEIMDKEFKELMKTITYRNSKQKNKYIIWAHTKEELRKELLKRFDNE